MRGATRLDVCHEGISPEFQSTRPMRGATYTAQRAGPCYEISIHAPHAGRDIRDDATY